MTETTGTTPATAVLTHCCICDARLIGGTAVSIIERGTGPARTLYACPGCMRYHNLLPLGEQEQPVGDGRLIFRGQ